MTSENMAAIRDTRAAFFFLRARKSRNQALRSNGFIVTPRMPLVGPDGTLYFPATNGFSAQKPEGVERWSAPCPRPSAIHSTGRLYSLSGSNIVALDFTGNVRWSTRLPAPATRVLIGEQGRVFAGTAAGIVALDTNGVVLWTNRTAGEFVPLAGGGVLVVRAINEPGRHELYQLIDPEGNNGPTTSIFVGSPRHPLTVAPPVLTAAGDLYAEWQAGPSGGTLRHLQHSITLARSSWPLPFGHRNTGRAIESKAPSSLLVEKQGATVILRAAGISATATLESSTDLRSWQVEDQLTPAAAKSVSPEGHRYYRLRTE